MRLDLRWHGETIESCDTSWDGLADDGLALVAMHAPELRALPPRILNRWILRALDALSLAYDGRHAHVAIAGTGYMLELTA